MSATRDFDARAMALVIAGAVLIAPGSAAAQPAPAGDRDGAIYLISHEVETAQTDSNGSNSSSTSRNVVAERVLKVRPDGLELEYDFPRGTKAQDRERDWRFPLRVLRPAAGPPTLLDRPAMEARIARWLKKSRLTRADCGRWIFTWNAFRIECDPQSALAAIADIDLRPGDLRDGGAYRDPAAAAAMTLGKTLSANGAASFGATIAADPEHVRRERAEADVAVAEVNGKPVTLDDALRARSREAVSGTITVSFETDPAGVVRQRSRVTKLEITRADGVVENRTVTETVKRRDISVTAQSRSR